MKKYILSITVIISCVAVTMLCVSAVGARQPILDQPKESDPVYDGISVAKTDVQTKLESITYDAEQKVRTITQRGSEQTVNQETDSTTHRKNDLKLGKDALTKCLNYEKQLRITMQSIADRQQQRFDKISTVYDKVASFYVQSGRIVENYKDIAKLLTQQRAAAQATITLLGQSQEFACTAAAPHQRLADFRTQQATAVVQLTVYRDSLKELIKAIQSSDTTPQQEERDDKN
ncbi:hypothetical protein A2707_00345 [Candidatus Saccharibacteria bacterium RIFCSPHIGHO2_01_FULL_45_15]|nr:MAG: hypothetical protein A2707_00345 [Candidatus Saccharibacteria bacterium RIFCSPHIGHO2_01_FULL_45_15]OGL27490.1 MAG: hypothetical protein A3C39_03250 [Candidatus Saccharibacteria bacterium RIFCSPHIGHO2_02_FULL_46_12]